nr:hypothetical protein [Paraliomyxa miuraensis]
MAGRSQGDRQLPVATSAAAVAPAATTTTAVVAEATSTAATVIVVTASAATTAVVAEATAAAASATRAIAEATATATAATRSVTEATTATATATGTGSTLFGLVHAERPAVDHGSVHALDGLLGILVGAHGQEGEAPGPAGFPVGDDLGIGDHAELLEGGAEALLRGLEGQVAHEQSLIHLSFVLAIGPRRTVVRSSSCSNEGAVNLARSLAARSLLRDRHR